MSKELKELNEKFPFLTLYQYADVEGLCIIQNHGKNVVTVYDFNAIQTDDLKKKFIEMGNIWWWESNRKVPINLFFKQDFDIFQKYARNFVTKEFKIIHGHSVSLHNLNQKRVKRRRVELVIKNK
jgi:hypothetical protein